MDFIREQIKEKPVNRKKIAQKIGFAALYGLVFAFAACMMFLLFIPIFRSALLADTEETSQEASSGEPESQNESNDVQKESESESESDSESESGNEDNSEIEQPGNTELVIPDISLTIDDYQELQNELYRIGNNANKSIVTVTALTSETDWMNNAYETEDQGSGVIISEDSNYLYILTEKRVVPDTARVSITFIDETKAEATLLKYDGNTGVAVLAVEKRLITKKTEETIVVAKVGNSFTVSNGTIVIALGSPLGTNYSILTGNITSIDNEVVTWDKNYSVFTTDIVASENGSGILINTQGEIVGMVIQAFSGSQEVNTLTAVSISEISGIVERLVDDKDIPHVGLYVSTVTNSISSTYDIPKGVFIKEVLTDSPAMYAGLQSGDVITKVNGEEVYTDEAYSTKIRMLIPGTTCEITVYRQSGDAYIEVKCEVVIGVLE